MIFALKIAVSASVIAFASWLSGKRPELAGFIIALPIATLLSLVFSYLEYRDAEATISFARSILLAVPISYLFFLPFFLSDRLHLGFWDCYFAGLILLGAGYFVHRAVMAAL
jgi:hypothetical protein